MELTSNRLSHVPFISFSLSFSVDVGSHLLRRTPPSGIAQSLEVDHLRKKLAEQSKRIEVLVCEKSSLTLEMQNGRQKNSIESIMGSEFREFAPRKVHRFIIQFDEKCQQALAKGCYRFYTTGNDTNTRVTMSSLAPVEVGA